MTNEELDELVARLRPMNGCNEFDEAVAARTALDAALADARKAGKLEGLREAAEACREQRTAWRVGQKRTAWECGNDSAVSGCVATIRALAARVEGGDA